MARDNFIDAKKLVDDLNTSFLNHEKAVASSVVQLDLLNKEYAKIPSEYLKSIKTINAETSKTTKTRKQLSEAEKESLRLEKSVIRSRERLKKSTSDNAREIQRLRLEQQRTNRTLKDEAILSSTLVGAYQKLNLQRTQASRRLRDLLASEKASNAEIRKAQREFNKLDARVRKADMAVRDHTKNVGNYRSALGGLGGSLRSLMGAFGMIGGVYLFARALRDAFSRVREFDKAMQNLTGIFGTSREELRDLENEIKSVAGSSVNTSNQVADLATAMVALGKTKREVIQLLKPVNDLSIALGSSAEATGEFLIQTLNAFGKGAESGEEFANIIAKVRTSTALDFERIQIAMGYLAPVANALNMTLEETSAILGVLVDNGIKAQRAGRLMGSAFGRLAQNGMTLEQALAQINASQDKLVTSTELFGTEAGTLGLILADNTQKVKEYTKSFEDASGSLDKLTNEQLKSMDAQLKILDSSWESFILSIENGTGPISKTFSTFIGWINESLNWLTKLNTSMEDRMVNGASRAMKRVQEILNNTSAENFEEDLGSSIESLESHLLNLRKRLGEIQKTQSTVNWQSVFNTLGLRKESGDVLEEIGEIEETIEILKRALKGEDVLNLDDLVKEIEGASGKTEKLIKGTAKWLQAEIAALKKTRDETALTARETQLFNNEIEKLEKQLEKLTSGLVLANSGLKGYKKSAEDALQPTTDLAEKLETAAEKATRLKNATQAAIGNVGQSIGMIDGLVGGMAGELATLFVGFSVGWEKFGDKAERAAAISQAVGGIIIKSLEAIRNAQNINTQNQIDNLERQKNIELEFAGESAAARGEIEERFAERKQELQEKQARNEKAMSIMQAVIATAVAVVNALKLGPAGIALASIIGALGAAQIAVIASTPIPQFAEGVQNFEGGQAIVGDGGKREPITDKKGKLIGISPAKPTLVNLPKGANVYPSELDFYRELNGVLSSNGIAPNISVTGNGLTEENVYNAMKKAIGSRPTSVINMDKNGFSHYIYKKNMRIKEINNKGHFKSKSV